mmetsp:Transcript_1716/g.2665  ORF Transcript_1716/g.2665 Transcript_1716/m.2665 type:complete len:81 (-) Transcript_1716:151-393(-)
MGTESLKEKLQLIQSSLWDQLYICSAQKRNKCEKKGAPSHHFQGLSVTRLQQNFVRIVKVYLCFQRQDENEINVRCFELG